MKTCASSSERAPQVAVRSSPSRDAVALSYKRKGELIFARSQNFSGWLRLAGPRNRCFWTEFIVFGSVSRLTG